MAPHASVHRKKAKAKWSMTVMMNARDLSRDDDFLSHLLVEHLGTDESPLQVHKMDPSRRLPKHDPADVLAIVKKYVVRRGGSSTSAHRVKRAVDALLELVAVKQYLHKRSVAQINAFATHASRYFELYLPTGSIEISHTSRYSHRTGKSELCILATTPLKVGQVISDLKGSLAHLTVEEDEELKKTDSRRRDGGIRRDFSVIHSNQKNKSHLFLGPARFVNHDCDHNVELFRDGRVITFRVIKTIAAGQEVTAHYGEGYFGKGNRHCLCQTCERRGKGGYKPEEAGSEHEVGDDSSTDEETREERIKAGLGLNAKGNPNERRTRRGVYAILPEEDTDDEDRVGATEKVAAAVPQQVGTGDSEAAQPAPPSSSTSASTSTAVTPTLSSENAYVKQHDRQISNASSALSSLPDGDSPASHSSEQTPSPPSHLPPSSVEPPAQPSAQHENIKPLSTPTSSRMSTRSLTASKGKAKEENASATGTPGEKANNVPPVVEKRSLRGSRSIVTLPESVKQHKALEDASADTIARPTRQTRQSLPSATSLPKGSDTGLPNDKRSPSGNVSRTVSGKQSKSATPAVGSSVAVKPTVGKDRSNVPCCGTCAGEMRHLIGVKSPKKAVHMCARCKRHLAIFGAPWPNRNPSAEMLSSSSSESSSTETLFETVHEKLKDIAGPGHKFKYSRKYVEVKHPAIERPVKRRKTDPTGYGTKVKSAFYHSSDQLGISNEHFGGKDGLKKTRVYSAKTFSIPGGAQRSRAFRALSKETLGNSASTSISLGMKRRWGDSFEDPEQLALDTIRSRKRGLEGDAEGLSAKLNPSLVSGPRRTIRRFPSLPSLPAAKPLAALCSRPTPNLFARHSWAVSEHGDADVADGDSMDVSSDLTELPDQDSKQAFNAGQKRKRESAPSDSRPKGRRFYMKDEKKPMPKGWVLVTDSSEETGEEEEEEAGLARNQVIQGGSANGVSTDSQIDAVSGSNTFMGDGDARNFSPANGTDSPTASTPSLAHTPSSRATSTPTQSSGTLVEEHTGTAPSPGKRVVSVYSLRRSTADLAPSTAPSPKRRKVSDEGTHSPHKLQSGAETFVTDTTTPHGMEVDDSSEKNRVATPPASGILELEDIDLPLDDSKIDGPITMVNASFPPSGGTAKEDPASLLVAPDSSTTALFLGNCGTHIAAIEVPDSDSKRVALEVSNIIHGTAFSYGLPDARTTWKPNYHFSELSGWDSGHYDT